MATDKFMRIGGRGDDGTAKALKTTNEGVLEARTNEVFEVLPKTLVNASDQVETAVMRCSTDRVRINLMKANTSLAFQVDVQYVAFDGEVIDTEENVLSGTGGFRSASFAVKYPMFKFIVKNENASSNANMSLSAVSVVFEPETTEFFKYRQFSGEEEYETAVMYSEKPFIRFDLIKGITTSGEHSVEIEYITSNTQDEVKDTVIDADGEKFNHAVVALKYPIFKFIIKNKLGSTRAFTASATFTDGGSKVYNVYSDENFAVSNVYNDDFSTEPSFQNLAGTLTYDDTNNLLEHTTASAGVTAKITGLNLPTKGVQVFEGEWNLKTTDGAYIGPAWHIQDSTNMYYIHTGSEKLFLFKDNTAHELAAAKFAITNTDLLTFRVYQRGGVIKVYVDDGTGEQLWMEAVDYTFNHGDVGIKGYGECEWHSLKVGFSEIPVAKLIAPKRLSVFIKTEELLDINVLFSIDGEIWYPAEENPVVIVNRSKVIEIGYDVSQITAITEEEKKASLQIMEVS